MTFYIVAEFTRDRFLNGLRIMLNIDHDVIIAAGIEMGLDEWREFQENPWLWLIKQSDEVLEKFWPIMIDRGLLK